MSELGRVLLALGVILVVAGTLVLGLTGLHLPLGRLPGDLSWRGRGWSVWFPVTTSIVLSVLFSLVFWVIHRLSR